MTAPQPPTPKISPTEAAAKKVKATLAAKDAFFARYQWVINTYRQLTEAHLQAVKEQGHSLTQGAGVRVKEGQVPYKKHYKQAS